MGGEIGVKSVLGEGSTFYTEIPFLPSDQVLDVSTGKDLSGLNILTISSSENYLEVCNDYLQYWNAKIETAEKLSDCLVLVEQRKDTEEAIDIILIPDFANDTEVAQVRQSFIDAGMVNYPRFVIGKDPEKRSEILENIEEVTLMKINPLKRTGLVTAVAIAAGRASPEVQIEEEIVEINSARSPTTDEALAYGKLILLAEDNFTNQEVIRRQLNHLGYACDIANDGKEAYEMWCKKEYCLLLTDCHMPEWDGFELTAAIRKDEESTSERAPILAITANALQGEAERCISSGMDDYMAKPVDMKTLQATLFKWMGNGGVTGANERPADEEPRQVSVTGGTGELSSESCPVDSQVLFDLLGDDDEESFKEVMQSYVDSTKGIIAEVMKGTENDSAEEVKAAAHKLKSSSRSVGAAEIADLSFKLETAGRDNDWGTISELAPKLEPLFQDVQQYVKSL